MLNQILLFAVSAMVLGAVARAALGLRLGLWLIKLGAFLAVKSLVLYFAFTWFVQEYERGNWMMLILGALTAICLSLLLVIYAVFRFIAWTLKGAAHLASGQHRSTVLGAIVGAAAGELVRRAAENRRLR